MDTHVILLIAMPLHLAVAIFVGMMIERMHWNKLIENGTLLEPNKS